MPASPRNRVEYYLVEYRWPAENTERIRALYDTHRAHVDSLAEHGKIWLIGTLSTVSAVPAEDYHADGRALAIFTDLDTAREFIAADPLFTSLLANPSSLARWSPISYGLPEGAL